MAQRKPTPGVITWFRVYAGFMVFLYVLVTVGGVALALFSETLASGEEPREVFLIRGVVFAVIGLPLIVMYIVGLFMPAKSWAWIYGIVLIGFGMTSCCFIPACVPLLIFWIKPETQTYFGRTAKTGESAGLS
jgi:uncharacterized membrane protein